MNTTLLFETMQVSAFNGREILLEACIMAVIITLIVVTIRKERRAARV